MSLEKTIYSTFSAALEKAEQRLAGDVQKMAAGRERLAKTRALRDVQKLRRSLEKDQALLQRARGS